MIKGIVFDFDGVIVESLDIKTKAFTMLFESEGRDIAGAVVEHHCSNPGVSRFDKFKYIYKEILKKQLSQDVYKDLCVRFSKLVLDEVVNARYVKGAKEFLESRAKDYIFFIVSATPQDEIREILKRREISQYFKGVYGSPEKKTDIVKHIINTNKLMPGGLVYIGDALSDYNAAMDNAVHFIARINSNSKRIFANIDCTKIDDLTPLSLVIKNINI